MCMCCWCGLAGSGAMTEKNTWGNSVWEPLPYTFPQCTFTWVFPCVPLFSFCLHRRCQRSGSKTDQRSSMWLAQRNFKSVQLFATMDPTALLSMHKVPIATYSWFLINFEFLLCCNCKMPLSSYSTYISLSVVRQDEQMTLMYTKHHCKTVSNMHNWLIVQVIKWHYLWASSPYPQPTLNFTRLPLPFIYPFFLMETLRRSRTFQSLSTYNYCTSPLNYYISHNAELLCLDYLMCI